MSRVREVIQDSDHSRNQIIEAKYSLFMLLDRIEGLSDKNTWDSLLHEILSRDKDVLEEQKRRSKK